MDESCDTDLQQSCATAASKAATYMLLTGKLKQNITIQDTKRNSVSCRNPWNYKKWKEVTCAVKKDGGDDPDITSGALIFQWALLTKRKKHWNSITDSFQDLWKRCRRNRRSFTLTEVRALEEWQKPGLDQPVGNAAINHVPREMIEKRECKEVCALADFCGVLHITISVLPDGERLAELSLQSEAWITWRISILGTSGIVEPMSSQALLDTIQSRIEPEKSRGYGIAAVSPGNYGLDTWKKHMVTTLTGA